jgi:hypothetical protein
VVLNRERNVTRADWLYGIEPLIPSHRVETAQKRLRLRCRRQGYKDFVKSEYQNDAIADLAEFNVDGVRQRQSEIPDRVYVAIC